MAKLTKETFIEALKEMTILEIKELVDAMKDEFGIDPSAVAAAGPAAAPVVEEQTEFDVNLVEIGATKLQVIKVIKEITGLGLKESKELVDNAPKPIKQKISKAEAEDIQQKVEAVGAKVEIK